MESMEFLYLAGARRKVGARGFGKRMQANKLIAVGGMVDGWCLVLAGRWLEGCCGMVVGCRLGWKQCKLGGLWVDAGG